MDLGVSDTYRKANRRAMTKAERDGLDDPPTFLSRMVESALGLRLDSSSGAVVWGPKRIAPGIYSASPVLADGKIYATSEDGITTVLRAGPKFEVLAENHLDGYTLGSPAISRGEIFMRNESALYCISNP
jgi:hypothetical protein